MRVFTVIRRAALPPLVLVLFTRHFWTQLLCHGREHHVLGRRFNVAAKQTTLMLIFILHLNCHHFTVARRGLCTALYRLSLLGRHWHLLRHTHLLSYLSLIIAARKGGVRLFAQVNVFGERFDPTTLILRIRTTCNLLFISRTLAYAECFGIGCRQVNFQRGFFIRIHFFIPLFKYIFENISQ